MKKGDIPLHPELGVNPRLTTCRHCGADLQEIVLLGRNNCITTCPKCGANCYGLTPRGKCPACKSPLQGGKKRELTEGEKIPLGLCEACAATHTKVKEVVAAGGVHVRCKNCGMQGAIAADHPLAIDTRDHYGLHNGEPCGVELPECPQCSKE